MLGEGFPTNTAPLAFLDLEMTGLEPGKHEIVEIAVVLVSQPGLDVLEEWDTKVMPQHLDQADPVSLQMIGYSDANWKGAVTLQEAMEQFTKKTDGHIIAGWNCAYDWAFLELAMHATNTKTRIHKRILDCMSFAYGKLYPKHELSAMGLAATAKRLGIPQDHHHQALADAKMTYLVYKALVEGMTTA